MASSSPLTKHDEVVYTPTGGTRRRKGLFMSEQDGVAIVVDSKTHLTVAVLASRVWAADAAYDARKED
jgi:hypothetical protein